ncbi:MAG TPA: DUF4912 domain-containing protein [Verrucomicrobiae bacterium]|nr:DUF4912 domain-containing protein [Verrucomicrobiae bacterium]
MKAEREKKAATKSARAPRVAREKPKFDVPSILLEGDAPPASPAPSGPGERYARPAAAPQKSEALAQKSELPEAYGTGRLLLAARDPHWLYAHWDLTREQLKSYNARSADGHLVIRIYNDAIGGQPCNEVHVHPESVNWFVNVATAGAKYVAELGFYDTKSKWNSISTSGGTITPPDSLSEDTSAWFATLPTDLQLGELLRVVKTAVSDNIPLMEAIQQLRGMGYKQLPDPESVRGGKWTAEQEQALASLINMDSIRRVWIGSIEITELIRRKWQQELFSAAAAEFSKPWSGQLFELPSSIGLSSVSSPFGGQDRQKKFWFNVNAELIIYGATEADATVRIGDRQIKLRPDGSFSYRFALPDGKFDLPATATSADGTDQRAAALTFSRKTDFRGDVQHHPQDPNLRVPSPQNVS